MRKPAKFTLGAILVSAVAAIVALPPVLESYNERSNERRLARGKALAAAYCAACHLEPHPDMLPKRSWDAALGYMGYWLGMENIDYLADYPAFVRESVMTRREVLVRENVMPGAPLLQDDEWDDLRYYYVESAPGEPLPQRNKPALGWDMSRFEVVPTDYRVPLAVTTLVRIREATSQIYIGNTPTTSLAILGADGQLAEAPRQFGPAMLPVDIEFIDDTAYIASIGDFLAQAPSEAKLARIARLAPVDTSIEDARISVVLDDLYRMADMEIVDLNNDGVEDFIVSGFGARFGNVAWYESLAAGGYTEHVLSERPGAVRAQAHDFNGDGMLDIAVLLTDAREGFYILINDGTNTFETRTIFETHSGYGHTYFELQDFNADGLMDVLTVNGDNVDSDPYNTLKNYHGIRIYLNQGNLDFAEAYFYPLYGAFGAKAADFDNDGDLDIAAISFYPDFEAERRESFTYLQNDGDLSFSATTSEEMMGGRWMTIDAGDMDADGDIDVILGGAYIGTGLSSYPDVYDELLETGPPVLILKNTLR